MKTAIIVFAHGSPVAEANEGVQAMTAEMARRGGYDLITTAFLDSAPPTLGEAVEQMAAAGAKRIVVVPFFLTLGLHLRRDLPGIAECLREKHAGIQIDVTGPLEGHPALVDAMLGRAGDALHGDALHGGEAAGKTR